MTALAILHKDEILRKMASGLRVSEVAKQLGITPEAIYQNLSNDPDYQAAKIVHHANRLDDAEQSLIDSSDQLSLARAREVHKAFSWRASVECSRLWGSKQEVTVNSVQVDINKLLEQRKERLVSAVSNTVDSTCTQVETESAA